MTTLQTAKAPEDLNAALHAARLSGDRAEIRRVKSLIEKREEDVEIEAAITEARALQEEIERKFAKHAADKALLEDCKKEGIELLNMSDEMSDAVLALGAKRVEFSTRLYVMFARLHALGDDDAALRVYSVDSMALSALLDRAQFSGLTGSPGGFQQCPSSIRERVGDSIKSSIAKVARILASADGASK
jgi:monoamine oxidase